MKTNLNTYRTYSSGKLELVRNNIDNEFSKVEKKIEALEDEKDLIKDKIAKIENIIEENVEKKLGKDPSKGLSGDRNFNIFFLIYYPLVVTLHIITSGFDNFGAIVIGFVIMMFLCRLRLGNSYGFRNRL